MLPGAAREEEVGHAIATEDAMVAHVTDILVEGGDELLVVIGHDVELVWLGRQNLRLHYIR